MLEPNRGSLVTTVLSLKKNKTLETPPVQHETKQSMQVDHEVAQLVIEFMQEEEIERNQGLYLDLN